MDKVLWALRVIRVHRATPEDRRGRRGRRGRRDLKAHKGSKAFPARRDPKGIPELQAGRQGHRVYRGQPVLRHVLDPAV